MFGSILDAYRPTLEKDDPLFIGDGDRLGVADLRRGRVHGLNQTYFKDTLRVKYVRDYDDDDESLMPSSAGCVT